MSDQPPDEKYVPTLTADVKTEKPKLYYIPNRHDRRAAAAIKRKEERKKRKNAK